MSFVCNTAGPTAVTKTGMISGYTLDGIKHFLGIKYADAKRFHMPHPVTPWEGVKAADGYGFTCPLLYEDEPGSELRYVHRYWPSNEDCQYLNIWTAGAAGDNKPVMVWIHGGGYSFGSCLELTGVNGKTLCENGDVVVVTLNHRLNILGFLNLSGYGEEYRHSANLGLADIVAALMWIKENIAAFGGDPDNVTLFGQSGGGGKIRALMQTPAAEGLFHKAIVQSGVFTLREGTPAGRKLADTMLAILGSDNIKDIENLPWRRLYDLYQAAERILSAEGIQVQWCPSPGDYYLGDGRDVGFTEFAKKIPTISGTTVSEFMYGNLPKDSASLTGAELDRLLAGLYGGHTDEMKKLFADAYPDHPMCDLLAIDSRFCFGNISFLDAKSAASSAPTYGYTLSYDFPLYDGSPAWHCSEIPFVFHNNDEIAVCRGEGANRLQAQMCEAWTSFARSGRPSSTLLPEWPEYDGKCKSSMIFDAECRIANDHARKLLSLHDEIMRERSRNTSV